jgi:hypothetical protein
MDPLPSITNLHEPKTLSSSTSTPKLVLTELPGVSSTISLAESLASIPSPRLSSPHLPMPEIVSSPRPRNSLLR